MKKVFIVVLNWNGKEYTRECLRSLNKLVVKDFKLQTVVVDNASTDGSVPELKKEFFNEVFIENKENLGFAEGNNVGIRYALKHGADYVMLLNNDTLVAPQMMVQLIAAAEGGRPHSRLRLKVKAGESDKKIGIIGPKIYFAPGFEFHKDRYKKNERGKVFWYAGGVIDWDNVLASHRGVDEVDQEQYDRMEETDFVSGCAMMVKREVFDKIGLLDSRYFLYYEDSDFCQRAKRAGFKVIYTPKAYLWHLNAESSAIGGPLHDYYIARNRMLLGMKYAPLRTKLALIRESIKLLFAGRKWQRIGIKDFYFAVAGEATRNKLAYLRKFGKGSYEV